MAKVMEDISMGRMVEGEVEEDGEAEVEAGSHILSLSSSSHHIHTNQKIRLDIIPFRPAYLGLLS